MKKSLMLLAFAGLSSVAMAQNVAGYQNTSDNKYEVFTNKFWNNWFISAGGGAEILIGNGDAAGKVKDRISPTLNFSVGKWFTPGLALRLQYSGLQARGFTKEADNGYIDGGFQNSANAYKQKFNYMNLHGDALFNLNALIGGYNPKRVYEVIPYVGVGVTHSYSSPKREALSVNAGIINRFRLSSAMDINLELSAMGVENKFDGELNGKRDFDGVLSATVGLTYRFPKREFKKPVAVRQLISEGELSNIREKMNALAAENGTLKKDLAEAQKEPEVISTEVIVKTPDIAPRSVFFNIGSAKVSEQELVNLEFLADQMKEYPNLKFKVTGYADSSTGSVETNKRLSIQRAQAVVDALVGTYNIDRNRMTIDAVGGVSKFDKVYLNRMALVDVVK